MGLARSLNNQETGASIIIWEQTFPSLRLCTKNTWWALIERPYSCAPQAVGAVYDRPGFFVQSPPGGERSGSLRPITRHGAAREREAKNRMSLLGLAWLPPIRGRRDGR